MKNQLEANIKKFIIFNALSSFVLYYGIDKVFMQSRGLSTTNMVTVEIVFAVLVILLEVPSGAISDRWSRKYVLALNVFFFMLNTLLWVLAQDLNLFILGSTAAAIHMALRSGTDTSFLYDTLSQLNRSEEYEKIYGRSVFWANLIAIPAGIIGPVIAQYAGLSTPFWLTLPFSFAALIVALSFDEPKIHRTTHEMDYWKHITETASYIYQHPTIIHITSIAIVLGATIVILDEYAQLYFISIGIPVFALGLLGSTGHLIEALASKIATRLSARTHNSSYITAIFLSLFGFLGIGLCGR